MNRPTRHVVWCAAISAILVAAGPTRAADTIVVTVLNKTGQDAADLHVTFTGAGGTIFVSPGSVVAPGCPTPAVPSNGMTTDTAVIDWGVDCVPNGGTVLFIGSTPNGPLAFSSGFWTDINGVNIGAIGGMNITTTSIPGIFGGGPVPNGIFWRLRVRTRYAPVGGAFIYSPWFKPPGQCWTRWCCWIGLQCFTRVELCVYKSAFGRLFLLRGCVPVTGWKLWRTLAAGWLKQVTTIHPPPGDPQDPPGGPPRDPPPLHANNNPGGASAPGEEDHKSDDAGANYEGSSNFVSAFLAAHGALRVTQEGEGEPPPPITDFEMALQEMAPGYGAAANALQPLLDEIDDVLLIEPSTLLNDIKVDVQLVQLSLVSIQPLMASGVIHDPTPFTSLSQGLTDLANDIVIIPDPGASLRFQNAAENALALAEGFDMAANLVQGDMYDGSNDLLERDAFLWTQVARLPTELYQFGLAMSPHARLNLSFDPALQSWGPEWRGNALVTLADRDFVSSGQILDQFKERVSEFGRMTIVRPGSTSGNIDVQTPLRVWFKLPVQLSRVVDIPPGDGLNIDVPALIAGDVDGDNCIGPADLAQVMADQGQGGEFATEVPASDVNADGIVDADDTAIVLANQGLCGQDINDCDYNGVNDLTDIANGDQQDCNGNQIPDFCDIRDGFSADDNSNGTPDECESILGDLDGDGDVDTADFVKFAQCFGGAANPPSPSCPPGVDADLDDDGDVDVSDFVILGQHFTGSL